MPRQQSALHQTKDCKVPNLFWRSISTDTLRANERYVALPPVALLTTTDRPLSNRYVRQDSALWTELHDGMLTTGRLKQALGMHESKAAQVVGIHPGSRGSHHLLSAYFHLLSTTAESTNHTLNTSSNTPSSSSCLSGDQSSITISSSISHISIGSGHSSPAPHPNESTRQQFNQQLAAAAAGSGTDSLPAWMAGKSHYSNIADLQQLCAKVALAGDIPVKMYWGKVQEAAALHTLLQIFPAAVVEEVGLFEVNLERLPAAWGVKKRKMLPDNCLTDITNDKDCGMTDDMSQHNVIVANLPRLGASPDGLIVHSVEFSVEDLRLAAARLQATHVAPAVAAADNQTAPSGSSSTSTASISALGQQQQQQPGYSSSRSSNGVGRSDLLCTDQQIVQWLLRQALDAVICNGVRPPAGVPTADTSSSGSSNAEDQEGAVDTCNSDETAAAPAAADSSTSTAQFDATGLAFKLDDLSILQELDSAAGLRADRDSNGCAVAATANGVGPEGAAADQPLPGGLDFQPVCATVLQLLQQFRSHSSSSSGGGASSSAAAAAAAGGSSSSTSYSLHIREVVEVKNHCPFAFCAKRQGKKGRVNVRYSWRPRGPAIRVHPQWVPQLQMHMLATGCESALLVSRCPETGVRVFRMWRDDAYLQTMMQLLQVLQTRCVVPQIQPHADMYSKIPGYRTFLHRTSPIARSAVCIAAGDEDIVASIPAAADGSNDPKFW